MRERPGGQGVTRGGPPVKSALFSKLSLIPYLVIAGLSGCGDTGDSSPNNAQGPQMFGEPCNGVPFRACPCPNGTQGGQLCRPDGYWDACSCQGQPPGTGGFGNVPNGTGNVANTGNVPVGGPVCGDGQISGGEQCDGQNQGGQTCATVSMGACTGGYLICTGQCIFDYTACQCGGGPGGAGGMGPGGAGGTGPGPGGTTGQP